MKPDDGDSPEFAGAGEGLSLGLSFLWAAGAVTVLAMALFAIEYLEISEWEATKAKHGCNDEPSYYIAVGPGYGHQMRGVWVCADGTKITR